MIIGMLIITYNHLEAIIGITRAALAKGHEVIIFNMDEGVRLLEKPSYTALCKLQGVTMSFCDHNAKEFDIRKELIPTEIVCGSQYNNAVMNHTADKVIVL